MHELIPFAPLNFRRKSRNFELHYNLVPRVQDHLPWHECPTPIPLITDDRTIVPPMVPLPENIRIVYNRNRNCF